MFLRLMEMSGANVVCIFVKSEQSLLVMWLILVCAEARLEALVTSPRTFPLALHVLSASDGDAYLEFFALSALEHAVRCHWGSIDSSQLYAFCLGWLRDGSARAARSSVEKAVRLTVAIASRGCAIRPMLELSQEALRGRGARLGAQLLRCLAEDMARSGGRHIAALRARERAALQDAVLALLPDIVGLLSGALAGALDGAAGADGPECDAVAAEALHAVLALVSWGAPLAADSIGADLLSHIFAWAQRRPVTDAACLALRVLADIIAKRFVPRGAADFLGTVVGVTLDLVSAVVRDGCAALPEAYMCAMTDFLRDLARVHRDRLFGGDSGGLLHLLFQYAMAQPTVNRLRGVARARAARRMPLRVWRTCATCCRAAQATAFLDACGIFCTLAEHVAGDVVGGGGEGAEAEFSEGLCAVAQNVISKSSFHGADPVLLALDPAAAGDGSAPPGEGGAAEPDAEASDGSELEDFARDSGAVLAVLCGVRSVNTAVARELQTRLEGLAVVLESASGGAAVPPELRRRVAFDAGSALLFVSDAVHSDETATADVFQCAGRLALLCVNERLCGQGHEFSRLMALAFRVLRGCPLALVPDVARVRWRLRGVWGMRAVWCWGFGVALRS